MAKRSVAIVDDHPLISEGMACLVQRHPALQLVAVGSVADDICSIAQAHQPDVIVADLLMAGDVFEAIGHAKAASPRSRIVVFTASTTTDHAIRSLKVGASAYVLKGSPASELIEAIEAVLRDEIYITPRHAAHVINAMQNSAMARAAKPMLALSCREDQIVKLLLLGKRNKEIAAALALSEKTVKSYMTNLMQKLNAKNRVEVVIAAQQIAALSSIGSGR